MRSMTWRFPACRPDALDRQALKVAEEAQELLAAIHSGEGDARVMEEAWDCVHACETLLRTFPLTDAWEARNAVIAKNEARGYYRC